LRRRAALAGGLLRDRVGGGDAEGEGGRAEAGEERTDH
jgi:hypothetical protein